jgi:hypothetical protein
MKIILNESELPKVFIKYIESFYPYLINGLRLDRGWKSSQPLWYATHNGDVFSVMIMKSYIVSGDGKRGYYINEKLKTIVTMFGSELFEKFFLDYHGININPYDFVKIKNR